MHGLTIAWFIIFAVFTTIAAWITAYRMRKKIKNALGKSVSEAELTSINTWMKVADAEQKAEDKRYGGKLGPPL